MMKIGKIHIEGPRENAQQDIAFTEIHGPVQDNSATGCIQKLHAWTQLARLSDDQKEELVAELGKLERESRSESPILESVRNSLARVREIMGAIGDIPASVWGVINELGRFFGLN